jgi:hypothetical protein
MRALISLALSTDGAATVRPDGRPAPRRGDGPTEHTPGPVT